MRYSDHIKPMLAKLCNKAFDHPDWLFEIKYDGYRAIAELQGEEAKLYSRNGTDLSKDFPKIYRTLQDLRLDAVIDGEIVALDERGNSSFGLLQESGAEKEASFIYYVFDLLELNGEDLRDYPLLRRKELLETVLPSNGIIRYADHALHYGNDFFKKIVRDNKEGMIAKKAASTYHEGKRSGEWLKLRHHNQQEAIICGYTAPRGGRKFFGSLILGVYENGILKYVGHAGSGFNTAIQQDLSRAMKPLETGHSPFHEKIRTNAPVTWIKPELVCNIKFTEWTREGYMRYPVFMGMRKDKSANEVARE